MARPSDVSSQLKPMTRFRLFAALIVCLWTMLILAVLAAQFAGDERGALLHARSDAAAAFEKDVLFRKWASLHGGVYVPVTETFQPNPYLSVPGRDVTTVDGRRLTLVNPAYMARLVHQLGEELNGVRGHITSLKPINPINEPDAWESETLRSFERGLREASTVVDENGAAVFRFMRPFITEASCLKCHGDQGYRVGEIRGGISISMPFAPFRAEARHESWSRGAVFAAIWLTGIVLILLAVSRISSELRTRLETERFLQDVNDHLSLSMRETSSDLAEARASLKSRDQAEHSLAVRLADAQSRLVEYEKTAALGLLVSGIAHGFNTPLGSIASSAASIDEIAGRILQAWGDGSLIMASAERNLVVSFISACREAIRRNGLADTSASFDRFERFLSEHSITLKSETLDELSGFPLDFDLEPLLPLFASPRADRLISVAANIVSLVRCDSLIALAVEKASRDVNALEQYSAEGRRLSPRDCAASALLEKALALFDTKDQESIRVVRSYQESVRAYCDPDAVSRVFFDLIKNAFQAMRYKGLLELSVSERDDSAVIEIANDGPPIPAAVRKRIFSPFFTTKSKGEATGLGLFLAKQIIERSGGSISFSSARGRTVFSVRLPLRPAGVEVP